LIGELEYPKIETRLIDEKFASVMGECVILLFVVIFVFEPEEKFEKLRGLL
jgi:hypothetical protein